MARRQQKSPLFYVSLGIPVTLVLALAAWGAKSLLASAESPPQASAQGTGHPLPDGRTVTTAAETPTVVSVQQLRETWKSGPGAVAQLYGRRSLRFQASVSYQPGQRYLTLGGYPPIYCHLAPTWTAAAAVGAELSDITARFHSIDSAGMHLTDCRLSAQH